MATQNIVDFCDKNGIQWFPIRVDLGDEKPEGGCEKILRNVRHPLYLHKKKNEKGEEYDSYKPETSDFEKWSEEQIEARQKLLKEEKWGNFFNAIAMDTSYYHHIDIDAPDYPEAFRMMLESMPYHKSTTKEFGRHIFISAEQFKPPVKKLAFKDTNKKVELLCGLWSYCPIGADVYNADRPIEDMTHLEDVLEIPVAVPLRENRALEAQVVRPSPNERRGKYHDLLDLITINPKDRQAWLSVCGCIKHLGLTNDDWLNFAYRNNLNMDKEKTNLFHRLGPNDNEECLLRLARGNPKFASWELKYYERFFSPDDAQDAYESASIITPTLKQSLVLCNEEWYALYGVFWNKVKDPSYAILTEYRKYLDFSIAKVSKQIVQTENEDEKEKLRKYVATYNGLYKTSNNGFLNSITKVLKAKLLDNAFANKLDNNPDFMAFKNGIVDLRTREIKPIEWSDYITGTIPYDYTPTDYTYLKSVLKKILNNNDEHLEYFLSLLGFCFIGRPEREKALYFMVDKTEGGCGDNGKTFFFDIMTALMPNYVYKSKASFIAKKNSKFHKQMIMTKGKRIVWLDELPKEGDFEPEVLKILGEGSAMENEVMFGTSENIPINYKLFGLTNHLPKIPPNEKAVFNRYNQVSFNSHFDRTGTRKQEDPDNLKFKADSTLPDKIKGHHYNEVFSMLVDYAHKYYNNPLVIPAQFKTDAEDTQKQNDEFGVWFNGRYTRSETIADKISLKQLVEESNMAEKLVKEGMERLKFKYERGLEFSKDEFGKRVRGGYKNVMVFEGEGTDDDEEYEEC